MKNILTSIIVLTLLGVISCTDKQEIVNTESGIKYLDVTVGEGRSANSSDLITIHFRGWFIQDSSDVFSNWSTDTTKSMYLFADSYLEGNQVKFILGDYPFIKGSDDGIIGMQAGGKRIIVIPSELAYGQRGAGPIPPNTDLRVLIEMIEVSDPVAVEMWEIEESDLSVTESGLKYYLVEPGEGSSPETGNVVTVHYSGFFEDGTKFDSSVERDEPYSFVVGNMQVIPGWDEGIRMLKKGGKARFIIPPSLGYGNRAVGSIPPNSTLLFDVELIDIK